MPLTSAQQTALNAALSRLSSFYDGDNPYNPATYPGAFRQGGSVVNFVPALKDVATVMNLASILVADATAAAASSPKAVRVDSAQTFLPSERGQGRINLRVAGSTFVYSSANRTLAKDDVGTIFYTDATQTITLPLLSDCVAGDAIDFFVYSGTLTLAQPAGNSNPIGTPGGGAQTVTLAAGAYHVRSHGSAWRIHAPPAVDLSPALLSDRPQLFNDAQKAQLIANFARAPISVSTSSSIAATSAEQPFRLTGAAAATHTLPAGSAVYAGWHSRTVINEGTAIKTIAVQTGDYLDGVQNGTLLLFPRQRAQFVYDTDGWRTIWVDRAPILSPSDASSKAAVTLKLPAGYNGFELMIRTGDPTNANATLYAILSDDDGASFKASAGQYGYELLAAQSTSTSSQQPTSNVLPILGALPQGLGGGLARLEIGANMPGVYPRFSVRAGQIQGGSQYLQLTEGYCSAISANRVNAMQILWSSGAGPLAVTMRGLP